MNPPDYLKVMGIDTWVMPIDFYYLEKSQGLLAVPTHRQAPEEALLMGILQACAASQVRLVSPESLTALPVQFAFNVGALVVPLITEWKVMPSLAAMLEDREAKKALWEALKPYLEAK